MPQERGRGADRGRLAAALWSLLFAAWQHNRDDGVSRHEALALCVRSLQKR